MLMLIKICNGNLKQLAVILEIDSNFIILNEIEILYIITFVDSLFKTT